MFDNQNVSQNTLRWFGLSLSCMLLIIAGMMYWRLAWTIMPVVLSIAAGALSIIYYAIPASRMAIFRAFSVIVYPIQLVVTFLILGIVYFVVLTPIAFALRLFGHDPLQRKLEPDSETYWQKREPEPEQDRYFKTY